MALDAAPDEEGDVTKAELAKFLEPFTDRIKIICEDENRVQWFVGGVRCEIVEGEGMVVLCGLYHGAER